MKIRAILLDPETKSVRFPKMDVVKVTPIGTTINIRGTNMSFLVKSRQTWLRDRLFRSPIRYVMVKDGDPRPLLFESQIEHAPYDAETFHLAIKSHIASQFLRGDANFRDKMLIVLAIVIIVLGIGAAI